MGVPIIDTPLEQSLFASTPRHSVEFFHIYTDEVIGAQHQMSIDYLKMIDRAWGFEYDKIVLIDNYNPINHILKADDALGYLASQEMLPKYWAFEKDMIPNAEVLLSNITNKHLKKNYESYIAAHGKYPCSLLTASWYLTRLGRLDYGMIKSTEPSSGSEFQPADRLFNLLPEDYKSVEERARKIILGSTFALDADRIQDLFYPTSSGRTVDLF